MNGVHDMGGMHGFGPVAPESDEPVFHHDWERRMYAIAAALGTVCDWTLDEDRHASETIPADQYLRCSYYEKWLIATTTLLLRHGYVSANESLSGKADEPGAPAPSILHAEAVTDFANHRSSYEREAAADPAFAVGARVRARNINPPGHTRLPRYVRGHTGTIDRIHGCHVFPDTNAHGGGEQPQWLYSVRFDCGDLWGGDNPEGDEIFIDLWEPYLEQI